MEYNNLLYEKYKRDDNTQYGEDGMIEELIKRMGFLGKIAVDIGASDGIKYSNTFNLVKAGWEVYAIEGRENPHLPKLSEKYPNLKYKFCYVSDEDTDDNINKVLDDMGCPKEVDIMSLDIDSIEYWIWDVLEINPKLMIVEIEPRNYPSKMIYHIRDQSITAEEKRDKLNPPQNLTGFGPMFKMSKKKGYTLIGHTITNLFFLRNDQVDKLNWAEVTDNPLSNFNPSYLSTLDKIKWSSDDGELLK
jgi:hypothetical protein